MDHEDIKWGTGNIDMIAIDAASHNLNDDLEVPSLTMTSDVTIEKDFSIAGTLDGVDLKVGILIFKGIFNVC